MSDEDLAGDEATTDEKYLKPRPLEEGEWGDIVMVRPNGQYVLYTCEPTLENLQSLVGGYIEVIPGFTKYGRIPCIVLGDEEGKLKNKPYNNRATLEWSKCMNNSPDTLVGDIVVLSGKAKRKFK